MNITINTAEALSALDINILSLLVNGGEVVEATEKPASAEPKAKPAKKAAKKPKPEPEPTPEPAAEEPLPEEEEGVEEEGGEETSDDELLDLAVKKATEMVGAGQAGKVREALDAAGANRVRELNKDNVREFFKALS